MSAFSKLKGPDGVVCCGSAASGARVRLRAKMTASPISRMGHLGGGRLPGSLAERHDAHQHSTARPDAKLPAATEFLVEGVEVGQEAHRPSRIRRARAKS